MWADRENGQSLENDGVDGREDAVGVGEQDHPHHNKSENRGIFLLIFYEKSRIRGVTFCNYPH